MNKFSDYMFNEATKKFIQSEGFINPTAIQKEVIPLACKGKSVVGVSATGSGKTHAFLIPIMEKIDSSIDEIQAVISTPTRELAIQIYQRAMKMSECNPQLKIRLIIGGMEKSKMISSLKKQPHIVIGTPGRIKDLFVNEQVLRVDKAKMLVVDEADMTLEMGFLDDVDAIAGKMNKELQMMSFSATIPLGLQTFLNKYMENPTIIRIKDNKDNALKIQHILIPLVDDSYENKLKTLLPLFNPYLCLIFANTRKEVATIANFMRDEGYEIIELHGDLTSRERIKAMKEISLMKKHYIVASDIAARGIDIEGVSHVISLGFPKELEYYIHRAGRTARAGRDGICYTLYQNRDQNAIAQLSKKGIEFHYQTIKNNALCDINAKKKHVKKDDPLEKEIAKIVHKKQKKVKPGYKKKAKQEVERIKRKAKRAMIQKDIKEQQKARAKAKMIEKREKGEN